MKIREVGERKGADKPVSPIFFHSVEEERQFESVLTCRHCRRRNASRDAGVAMSLTSLTWMLLVLSLSIMVLPAFIKATVLLDEDVPLYTRLERRQQRAGDYRPLQFGKRDSTFRPLQFGKKNNYRPLQFGKRTPTAPYIGTTIFGTPSHFEDQQQQHRQHQLFDHNIARPTGMYQLYRNFNY